MIVKIKCPKCGEVLEVNFETRDITGSQNEEKVWGCPKCNTIMTVALKELTARTEIYIHQRL